MNCKVEINNLKIKPKPNIEELEFAYYRLRFVIQCFGKMNQKLEISKRKYPNSYVKTH